MKQIDKFTRKAFEEGYKARSVFKLKDIQNKFHIIKEKDRVLDLGAAPGSWSQFCRQLNAKVTAIDLSEIKIEGVKVINEDIFRHDFKGKYEVVLSDLSPKIIGVPSIDNENSYDLNEKALEITDDVLIKGGIFLVKVFQNEYFDRLHKKMKKKFKIVKTIKPVASKKRSNEIYLLGINKI